MIEFIRDGGVIMYPLLAITAAMIFLAARSGVRLRRGERSAPLEVSIDAVLFWGCYGVIVGLVGTLLGVAQVAQAVSVVPATQVSSALVWGGVRVALNPINFALVAFSIAFLLWFALRSRYRRSS